MKIVQKILLTIMSIILLIPIITVSAAQETNIDENKLGSIRVILDDVEKGSKENVTFEIYKVANLKDGLLELTEDFKHTNIDLNNLPIANEMEKASEILSEVKATPTQSGKTDADGTVLFEGLELGAYLIKATDTTNYDDITPYIVSVPTYDNVAGDMIYDIETYPKHTPKPELPITSDNLNMSLILLLTTIVSIIGVVTLILVKGEKYDK